MLKRMLYGSALVCAAVLLYFVLSSCDKDTGLTYKAFEIARTAEGLYVLRPDASCERLCTSGDYMLRYSEDKESAYLYTFTNRELYFISKDTQTQLSDNVEHAELNSDCTSVAYFTGDTLPYSLYLHNREDSQSVLICSDAAIDGELGACVALSPSGNGVGYIKQSADIYSGWLYRDGEEKELGGGVYPVLVGENGSVTYIKGLDTSDLPVAKLCVLDGQEYGLGEVDLLPYDKNNQYSNTVSIVTDTKNERMLHVISDNRGRVIYDNSSIKNISQAEFMALFDNLDDDVFIFADSILKNRFMKRGWKNYNSTTQSEVLLIEDFVLNTFDGFLANTMWGEKKEDIDDYIKYSTVLSYNGNFNSFTDDNNSIYHINNDKKLVNSRIKNNKLISEPIAEGVKYFWMTGENNIYYQKDDKTLIYRSSGKERVVASDTIDALLSKDGKTILFTAMDDDINGDTLYSASKGRNKKVMDTSITDIQPLDGAILYYKNEDGTLSAYITDGRSKGKKILDGVDIRYIMAMAPYNGFK